MDGGIVSMIGALRRESGWTLIELLVAMSLMLVVLSATLTSFNAFSNNTRRTTIFDDQQDQIRTTLDQIVRQARNLANPTTGSAGGATTTIAFASGERLVFQTTDPSKQWVSYCLDKSNAARESIWYQTTSNNALAPTAVASSDMVTGCPSSSASWQTSRQVADFVTNQKDSGVNRYLFTYQSDAGELPDPNGSPPFPSEPSRVATADLSKVTRVAIAVFLKVDPNKPPAETELSSGAFMRNQNQPPTASFLASSSGTTYTFDAGASDDPEQRTLLVDWYTAPNTVTSGTMPSVSALPSCSAQNPNFSITNGAGWGCLGTTVVLSKTISGSPYIFLRVTDPGGLQTMSALRAGGCLSAVSSSRAPTDCGAIP